MYERLQERLPVAFERAGGGHRPAILAATGRQSWPPPAGNPGRHRPAILAATGRQSWPPPAGNPGRHRPAILAATGGQSSPIAGNPSVAARTAMLNGSLRPGSFPRTRPSAILVGPPRDPVRFPGVPLRRKTLLEEV